MTGKHKPKSYLLVVAQFGLIAFFVWYCGVWGDLVSNILTYIAIAIGVWAIITMRFRVSVLPDVLDKQELFTGGPYRYIRHPMYTAVLTATFAWMLNRLDVVSVMAWLLIVIVLHIKLSYEEDQLSKKFSNYKQYKARTKRLIPYLY